MRCSTGNPGKAAGLVDASPYDARFNQLDSTQTHLVKMQDFHVVPHDDMPMDVYQQDDGMTYPLEVSQDSTRNNTILQQGREYFVQDNGPADARQQSHIIQQESGLTEMSNGTKGPNINPAMMSSTEANRTQLLPRLSERNLKNPRNLSSNAKIPQARLHSTPAFNPDDLTSKMTSNILSRLDPSKYNSKDLELAIQASVLSLVEHDQPNKKRSFEEISAARNATIGSEKSLFQCKYCPKKKKTQCDLTYVLSSFSSVSKYCEKLTSNHPLANTKSDTPAPTAAPTPTAPAASAAKTTGSATKTTCTGKSKPGSAPSLAINPPP